jgi:alkylhydroperoxidase/carboxymuconolactone decarboxylase family protein YurZ
MKPPWMDPGLRELVALAVLAAFGCGLALAQGEFLFVAIFGAASSSGGGRPVAVGPI